VTVVSDPTVLMMHEGQVTRRDDPEERGRVKVLVPGFYEPESPWAPPLASPGGGSAQRGHFEPPAVGATVCVFLKLGDRAHPRYLTGSWGLPGGVSDVPTNAAVEGDDRQNAVTEDAAWRVERDSRTASEKYLVRHGGSTLALLLDGATGKVFIADEAATEQVVLGTAFFADLNTLLAALKVFTTSLGALPGQGPAATTFSGAIDALVTALPSDLSQKVFVK
jgi:hypothetical protein